MLVVLTELSICGTKDPGLELPHNISALTKLKFLHLELYEVKTLPAEMPYGSKNFKNLSYGASKVWNIFQAPSHVVVLFQLL
jgi:hypothetical protein